MLRIRGNVPSCSRSGLAVSASAGLHARSAAQELHDPRRRGNPRDAGRMCRGHAVVKVSLHMAFCALGATTALPPLAGRLGAGALAHPRLVAASSWPSRGRVIAAPPSELPRAWLSTVSATCVSWPLPDRPPGGLLRRIVAGCPSIRDRRRPGQRRVVDVNGDGSSTRDANAEAGTRRCFSATARRVSRRLRARRSRPGTLQRPHGRRFRPRGHLDLAFANRHAEPDRPVGRRARAFRRPHSPVVVVVKPHPHGVAAGTSNGEGPDLVTDSWGEDGSSSLRRRQGQLRDAGTDVAVGKHPITNPRRGPERRWPGRHREHESRGQRRDGSAGRRQGRLSPACGVTFLRRFAVQRRSAMSTETESRPRSRRLSEQHVGSFRADGLTILLGDGRGGFSAMAGSPLLTTKQPNMVAIESVPPGGRVEPGRESDRGVCDPPRRHSRFTPLLPVPGTPRASRFETSTAMAGLTSWSRTAPTPASR